MNTNRLTESIEKALNAQITKEAHASQIYLSYASWAERQGLSGIAVFLFRHAEEERYHMMKILKYILKRGGQVRLETIPAPPENPSDLKTCFERAFKHEVDNTKSVYEIVKKSFDEADWATWNFMRWFVKEQVEEETLVMNLLDKLKISGGENIGGNELYVLDRDLGKIASEPDARQDLEPEVVEHKVE